ncbi:hypothetical protein PGT21_015706 [Puccinia graminis f. sp. tritici]|uniref:Uncharacterized protein n=1 Tax=Puccinia graminis f. sp. tritici TaxID=56615 RepID=A0A5B0MUH8_PUCGR|nr:hypothetical protein PGT21_015706 [Puccinia graminis f. sp. tritici]KAA1131604.1 hypothetical protein PGTUg99_033042 [Puccinia graminis f. sp. tritici]
MLSNKILVSFQILHYFSVSANPLLFSNNLVKRAESSFNRISNFASPGRMDLGDSEMEEAEEQSEHMNEYQHLSNQINNMEIGRQKETIKNIIPSACETAVFPGIPGWLSPYLNNIFPKCSQKLRERGIPNDLISHVERHALELLNSEKISDKVGQMKPEKIDAYINHILPHYHQIATNHIVQK